MTFIEKFDELKAKYGAIDESKLTENFAVQIELTDDDCGGIFYVAYMNAPFAVEPYDYHDNTASIAVSSQTLDDILSGKSDPVAEFLGGNLRVDGEMSHALMLVELMKKEPKAEKPKTAKKPAVKKDSAEKEKKAEPKKETAVKEKKAASKKTAKKKSE